MAYFSKTKADAKNINKTILSSWCSLLRVRVPPAFKSRDFTLHSPTVKRAINSKIWCLSQKPEIKQNIQLIIIFKKTNINIQKVLGDCSNTTFKVFAWWVIFQSFCLLIFSLKNSFRVSNGLNQDQLRHSVSPDLGQTICNGYQQMTKVAASKGRPQLQPMTMFVKSFSNFAGNKAW